MLMLIHFKCAMLLKDTFMTNSRSGVWSSVWGVVTWTGRRAKLVATTQTQASVSTWIARQRRHRSPGQPIASGPCSKRYSQTKVKVKFIVFDIYSLNNIFYFKRVPSTGHMTTALDKHPLKDFYIAVFYSRRVLSAGRMSTTQCTG